MNLLMLAIITIWSVLGMVVWAWLTDLQSWWRSKWYKEVIKIITVGPVIWTGFIMLHISRHTILRFLNWLVE